LMNRKLKRPGKRAQRAPPHGRASRVFTRLIHEKLKKMATELAHAFRSGLGEIREAIRAVPAERASEPWREGGWTRKQILGHMLDSAANNRQRFVRAASDGHYRGPGYAQQAWVDAHGYAEKEWETLISWWKAEHEILASVVDRIPEERLEAGCIVGDDAPVTLRFLIEDYLRHQREHAGQLA
jgi:DinB superfamily